MRKEARGKKYFKGFNFFRLKRWRRQWHPTPVLLPGKSHGWRSLVGCSPWRRWGSDTTERLHSHFSLSCIGEGNGNPLQCSCLENPRDRGAWWAAVYGVTQSRTWLKWLSSSSRLKRKRNTVTVMQKIGMLLLINSSTIYYFFFFGHMAGHVGSYFSDQGLNHWTGTFCSESMDS